MVKCCSPCPFHNRPDFSQSGQNVRNDNDCGKSEDVQLSGCSKVLWPSFVRIGGAAIASVSPGTYRSASGNANEQDVRTKHAHDYAQRRSGLSASEVSPAGAKSTKRHDERNEETTRERTVSDSPGAAEPFP